MNELRLFSTDPAVRAALGDFECAMALTGTSYRAVATRDTSRIELGGRGYFIKQHFGTGWGEILKNWLAIRAPIVDASHEWRAIAHLAAAGLGTAPLVAYGRQGSNPARRRSFVVTEEILDFVTLEDECAGWTAHRPAPSYKRAVLAAVADTARVMHAAQTYHRDFYICHLYLKQADIGTSSPPRLTIMDLHRALIGPRFPRRWRVKDVGSLYFSAMDIGLSRRDRLRFMARYSGKSLRATLCEDRDFWLAVRTRAAALYRKAWQREAPRW